MPQSVLTPSLLENLKATILFCSPLMMDQHEVQSDPIAGYKNFSSATDIYYPIVLVHGTKATLLIPGWIRERAAEVLFEGDEEDEPSIVHCILNAILKVINKQSMILLMEVKKKDKRGRELIKECLFLDRFNLIYVGHLYLHYYLMVVRH